MKTKILYFLTACLLLTACSSDEKPFIKGGDHSSEKYLSEGVIADEAATTLHLNLRHLPGILTASCDEYWCDIVKTETDPSMMSTSVELSLDRNDDWTNREAKLTLLVDGCTKNVRIMQKFEERMQPEDDVVYVSRDGGDITVRLKAKVSGNIMADLAFGDQPEWIEFEEVSYDQTNPQKPEYRLHFKSKENKGLGRICGVTVKAEESKAMSHFCLIQQPTIFNEEETISIDKAGKLDILIGTDKDNIRRVRNLKLTGEMNGVDWNALRSFFYKGYAADPSPDAYPVNLDLSDVYSVKGDRTFYSSLGYEPKKSELYVYQDNEIPESAFSWFVNLAGLILPQKTVKINQYAFAHNPSLASIDIPDSVEQISYGAFQACWNLKIVNISDNSRLRRLGRYAFSDCGPIEKMNLPISLTEIDDGCLNFAAKELKVHWPTPPEIRVPPTAKEGSVLYVPKGSAPLYREAFGWNRFNSILEFEE